MQNPFYFQLLQYLLESFTALKALNTNHLPTQTHSKAPSLFRLNSFNTNSTMPQTTILITGASRGLGLGILTRYLCLPNHTLVACVRFPTHPSSQSLTTLSRGTNSTLIVLRLDAKIPSDATDAVCELREKHGIEHLDIVIAAAGICTACPNIAEVDVEELKRHMDVNFYSVVALYQASREMLKASKREGGPIFMPIGSTAGCLE